MGETAPLSPSSISRINKQFLDDYRAWSQRPIADKYVYCWADGVYLDAGAEQEQRVMLVVIGVDTEGAKDLLAIEDAFGESAESWATLFESLRERGLKNVALLVADGAQGIWKAFSAVFPRAKQQRCWLHYADVGISSIKFATSKTKCPRSTGRRSTLGSPRR